MAQYEDKVLHELDGIKEYDNPMPGWLMAIWWGSLLFSAAYLMFYALSFGEGSMDAEYKAQTTQATTEVQAYFDANPLVPPKPAELLAGAKNQAVLQNGVAIVHAAKALGPHSPRPACRNSRSPARRRPPPSHRPQRPQRRPLLRPGSAAVRTDRRHG